MKEQLTYFLPKEVTLPPVEGILRPTNKNDFGYIKQWMQTFYIETLEVEPLEWNEKRHPTQNKTDSELFRYNSVVLYVWQPSMDKPVVSMGALIRVNGTKTRLNLIFTDKKHRRKGYGKALVAALCRMVNAENRTPILYVRADNATAIRLYEGLGFTILT
jgi:predicted GNAT family acetyltransferase